MVNKITNIKTQAGTRDSHVKHRLFTAKWSGVRRLQEGREVSVVSRSEDPFWLPRPGADAGDTPALLALKYFSGETICTYPTCKDWDKKDHTVSPAEALLRRLPARNAPFHLSVTGRDFVLDCEKHVICDFNLRHQIFWGFKYPISLIPKDTFH